jgi:hypothetical protein
MTKDKSHSPYLLTKKTVIIARRQKRWPGIDQVREVLKTTVNNPLPAETIIKRSLTPPQRFWEILSCFNIRQSFDKEAGQHLFELIPDKASKQTKAARTFEFISIGQKK